MARKKRRLDEPPFSIRDAKHSFRSELKVRCGRAHVGIDMALIDLKVLGEHADQLARRDIELRLVLPGVDRIENLGRHAFELSRHRETEIFVSAEFGVA